MRNKVYFVIILLGLIITASIASAITATLGNSRMILRAEEGETVENFLRVINTNDIPVTIVLSVSGDSGKDFKLKEEEFSLAPKEEKRAYFTIKARSEGTFENKVNVLFKPAEGNAVGLLANVILIVGESDSDVEDDDLDVTITGDVVQDNETINNSGFSFGQKNSGTSNSSFSLSPSKILIGSTTLLIIVLIILFIFLLKKPKKEARRPRE